MILAGLSGAFLAWLSVPSGEGVVILGGGLGGTPVIPGWEPWYFFIDDKVNAGSGNLFLNFTDLRVRARGWTLEVVRAYNGQSAGTDGDFGHGWTWNYGTRLVVDAQTGGVTWHDGDGSQHAYAYLQGSYLPPPGVHAKLTQSGQGTFTLWHLDGARWFFDSDGLPAVWADRNGNNLTFAWASPPPPSGPELKRVEDDGGLNLSFAYTSGRIASVTDPIGRTITYAYDGSGNLDTVTDPLGSNDTFDYDGGHRMTRWIDRAGVLVEFDHDASDRLEDMDVSLYDAINDGPLPGSTIDKMNISYVTTIGGPNYANVTNARNDTGSVQTDETTGLPEVVEAPVAGACGALVLCQRMSSGPSGGAGCACCGSSGGGGLNGDAYTLTWDNDRNLVGVEDALGNDFNYTYDAYGNVETYTDPLGNATTWGWTVTDNSTAYIALLDNVTNAGYTWTYGYDGAGNRHSETDPTGNYSTREYDDRGYVTSATDFRGYTTTYRYDTHGYLLNVTDALGNVTTYDYDGVGRIRNATNARNFTTSYEWDGGDRLVNVTDALGNVTSYTYNGRGDRLTVTDALNRTTTYAWNLTVGRVASITDARGNSSSYGYDGEGNLLEATNARGHATTYAYDAANRLTNVTDALGNSSSYGYDAAGRLTTITDRRGAVTTFATDALGRRVNVTDALGNITSFAYDEVGNLVNRTDARGYSTLNAYDALNRPGTTTDALGNVTSFDYDANGNLVAVEDPNGHGTSYAYDALDRLIAVMDPLNHTLSMEYDEAGNLVAVEDADGNITEYEYDGLNRRVRIRDALNDTTSFGYDDVGNLVNLTDANGHVTTQAWDEVGRLVEVVRSLGNTTRYGYDEVGNMVERVDPKGQQTNYTYDALNRLVRIDYPDGTNATAQYDAEGNAVYAEGFGFSRTDDRDLLGRVTRIEFDFGPFNKTVAYTYDEVGNRATMVDGENGTTSYAWDALNRLASMTAPGNLTWNFTYDAGSRRTNLTYPNGMYTGTVYDDADRITLVESRASNGTLLESFEYGYDAVGNRVNVTYDNGSTVTYAYDDTYRLVSEAYSWGLAINDTYDGTGNRLTETRNGVVTNYTYDAEDHLTARGNVTYEWDDNGNLVKKAAWDGHTTYAWDDENRLVEVVLPNGTTLTYGYSVRNQRMSESVDDDTTYLFHDFYDLTGRYEDLIAEYNETGTRVASFVHGPGADEPLAATRGGTTRYVLHDALGSVTARTTSAGTLSASYRYEAFGTLQPGSGVPNRYGFTSREFHAASELYYYRARWYDPAVGRFVTEDPLGTVDGPNLYAYVLSNPANLLDPSGQNVWDEVCDIACKLCWCVVVVCWYPGPTLNCKECEVGIAVGLCSSGGAVPCGGGGRRSGPCYR